MHAGNVDGDDMSLNLRPQCRERLTVVMLVVASVAEVVHHPHVFDAQLREMLDNSQLILLTTVPTIVAIEFYRGPVWGCQFDERLYAGRFPLHALVLLLRRLGKTVIQIEFCCDPLKFRLISIRKLLPILISHRDGKPLWQELRPFLATLRHIGTRLRDPELGMYVVAFEQFKSCLRHRVFGIEWKPPRQQSNAVFLERLDLSIESGYVLVAPIICEGLNAQLVQHLRPLFWSPFQCVKRDDAPGMHIVVCPERVRCPDGCASQDTHHRSVRKGPQARYGCWRD